MEIRDQAISTDEALREAIHQTGPPIIAGGITTAAAFFATSLTEFQGVAELGVIAGGGILLCVASTLLMLPCGIHWADGHAHGTGSVRLLTLETAVKPFWQRPWRTTITFAACTLFLLSGFGRLTYDHNLLNLQAEGLPSVAWETKLLEQTDRNSWFAVSMADSLEHVRERMKSFRQLDQRPACRGAGLAVAGRGGTPGGAD